MISHLLSSVPDYQIFLTVDELNASSAKLVKMHPKVARLEPIGHSTNAEVIHMLRIGHGSEQLLFFACPHPNEPIGAMTLEALSNQLVSDAKLRGERYTWNLIKCIDPDGTRLNEGWFKGPFTITHYASEFYRPAAFDQAEWTFPIAYKKHTFFQPIPETVALMTVITGLRPRFIYSLHNAGMGGGYYYLAPHIPEIDSELRALMTDRGIPLSLGEPEMPWGIELSPAIYQSTTLCDHYDFLEAHTQGNPANQLQGGEGSYGFAKAICNPAHLVCELPYFHDERISDTTLTDISRRDAILQGIEKVGEITGFTSALFDRLGEQLTFPTRFRTASKHLTELIVTGNEAKRSWAKNAPELNVPATVAQVFDNLTVGRFYNLLIVGMTRRALAAQMKHSPSEAVEAAYKEVEDRFTQWTAELEEEINYTVIPIKTLVEIQLGAAFHFISRL
jgi:hypothetical protein